MGSKFKASLAYLGKTVSKHTETPPPWPLLDLKEGDMECSGPIGVGGRGVVSHRLVMREESENSMVDFCTFGGIPSQVSNPLGGSRVPVPNSSCAKSIAPCVSSVECCGLDGGGGQV